MVHLKTIVARIMNEITFPLDIKSLEVVSQRVD